LIRRRDQRLPEQVHDLLRQSHASVATAESLTGGNLAALFTSTPGSSKTFLGGVVSYATEVKVDVVGVPAEVVERHGVISAECASSMAEGVRALLRADLGISTTGVAGPDRQEGHPAGTVFIAVASAAGTEVRALELSGSRGEIVDATCREALNLALEQLGSR